MLILTRRTGESLMIGKKITITVLQIKGNQARLGIDAPPDVPVHREEVFQRIEIEENRKRQELGDEGDDRAEADTGAREQEGFNL